MAIAYIATGTYPTSYLFLAPDSTNLVSGPTAVQTRSVIIAMKERAVLWRFENL